MSCRVSARMRIRSVWMQMTESAKAAWREERMTIRQTGSRHQPMIRARAGGLIRVLATGLVLVTAGLFPLSGHAQFSAAYELIKAVKDGDYAKAREEMLKCNCPTARDADGDPLIVLAARNGDLPMTRFLLESGANPNAASRSSGETALMVFARADNTEGIKLLAAHGADLDAVDKAGETALIQAVRARKLRAVRALLEAGADPEVADYQGQTALDVARQMRLRNFARLIEDAQ